MSGYTKSPGDTRRPRSRRSRARCSSCSSIRQNRTSSSLYVPASLRPAGVAQASFTDTTLRADVQPGGADTPQNAHAGYPMDLVHGRAPVRRPPHRRRLRPKTVLVRPRAERQAVQDPPVRHPSPSQPASPTCSPPPPLPSSLPFLPPTRRHYCRTSHPLYQFRHLFALPSPRVTCPEHAADHPPRRTGTTRGRCARWHSTRRTRCSRRRRTTARSRCSTRACTTT